MIYKSVFFASLCTTSLFLHSNPELGLEITYNDNNDWQLFLSGSYKTNYLETKVNVNPYKSFPHNISLQVLPVHKPSNTKTDNAFSTILATSLTATSGILLCIAKKEMERAKENQNIDLYLQHCDEIIKKSDFAFETIERKLSHD